MGDGLRDHTGCQESPGNLYLFTMRLSVRWASFRVRFSSYLASIDWEPSTFWVGSYASLSGDANASVLEMEYKVSTDHLVGRSSWTVQTRKRIGQVASYRSNVLISGPTGTGKELIARALHDGSVRSEKPFVPVNCASVPGSLFVSQLFGHEKGAFTGAQFASLGCFRAADGGTLFLDEIGELDLELQAKLLRVLQDRQVVPVGSHKPVEVDVRIVAATNRNLEAECQKGNFRIDLFYRLNVIVLESEPLVTRPEDIEDIANHTLNRAAIEHGMPLKQLAPEALSLLQAHAWPGNVRELQNVLERAVLFSQNEVLTADLFQGLFNPVKSSDSLRRYSQASSPNSPHFETDSAAPISSIESADVKKQWPTLADVEKQHIQQTLDETFNNQSAAAEMLGVDRKLLARKIKKYGLQMNVKIVAAVEKNRPSREPNAVEN